MRLDYDNGYYIGDTNTKGDRHGFGTYYWSDGTKYEGYWKNGEMEGKGKCSWPNNTKYDGEWHN